MTDVVLPDPRRVRRAVRWGVIRTSAGAVGWVFAVLVFLILIGAVFDTTLDRRNRFHRIIGSAFIAAQPDYDWSVQIPSTAAPFTYGNTMEISGRLRGVDEAWAPVTEESLYQNVLGHLGWRTTISPKGPVTEATRRGRPAPGETSALLADLPKRSRAMALVELRVPFKWDGDAHIFPTQLPAVGDLFWLEPPYMEQTIQRHAIRHPLTWPHETRPLTFRTWVDDLRDSDASNLEPFGLPTIPELREIGRATAIYAYLTQAVDIAEIAEIVKRPDVTSIRLIDVRLPVF